LSYFHRVIFLDEYYFSIDKTEEQAERPEDAIEATDQQLAVWNQVWQIAKRECLYEGDKDLKWMDLKVQLLEMWIQIVC